MKPFVLLYLTAFLIQTEITLATEEEEVFIQEGEEQSFTSRTLTFSSPCPRLSCGKLRSRMRKIRASDKCRDGCKFTTFRPALRGWECGSCQEWEDSYRGFDATLVFRNIDDPAVRDIFWEAAARWEAVVTGDLPSQRIPLVRKGPFVSDCRFGTLPRVVDDVLVCARLQEIDGSGNVLARASVGYRRRHSGLTIYGSMAFDKADLGRIIQNGSLKGIVVGFELLFV